MYICVLLVCIYIHIHIFMYICIYLYIYVYIHLHIHIHIYNMYTYVYVSVCATIYTLNLIWTNPCAYRLCLPYTFMINAWCIYVLAWIEAYMSLNQWHDSFISMTWLIFECDITHLSLVWSVWIHYATR